MTANVHPAAAIWPMLPDDELQRLAESITEVGLLEPVVLTGDGQVLDGRNRLAACKIASVEPTFETYDGDPVAYVLARNDARRHMTKGQRAMAAWMTAALGNDSPTHRSVAAEVATDHRMVGMAATVANSAPDLVANVTAGVVPLKNAYDEARRRKEAADSDDTRLVRLDTAAPDLAVQVREESLTLTEAEAAHRARLDEQHQTRREGIQAADELRLILACALAVESAIEVGEPIDVDPLIDVLRKSINTLERARD